MKVHEDPCRSPKCAPHQYQQKVKSAEPKCAPHQYQQKPKSPEPKCPPPQYQQKAKSPEPKCPRSEEPLFSTQCLPQSHWAPCDNTPSGFDAIGTLDSPLGSDSTNSEEDFYN